MELTKSPKPEKHPLPEQGVYYEARAVGIDPTTRTLTCVKEFCEVGGAHAH